MPHSEIPGSPIARISPGLFAACRVLRRLSVPRHPPNALTLRLIRSKTPPRTTAKPLRARRRAAHATATPGAAKAPPRVATTPSSQTQSAKTSRLANRHPAQRPGEAPGEAPSGGDRDRTDALLLAKQALSQLSYTPVQESGIRDQASDPIPDPCLPIPELVGQGGFEPPTSRLSSARSNQLSY